MNIVSAVLEKKKDWNVAIVISVMDYCITRSTTAFAKTCRISSYSDCRLSMKHK